ncbi:DUF5329 domain-containing protein [Desulfosediminicola flagellatus]|uniref:DUF5329 family protein n=1 Tax=Desulfosediminicola flagellatus TaxID=2569541 RepID=UPI00142F1E80|nr:DUF5329 domain-containing protein [Desulfosediminicola flagellatus]
MISSPALCKNADEIDYLLSFISTSECMFIRNGKEYDSGEAAEHLEMKYNHVKKRINSADVFIEKIASKSSLSRKAYTVRCEGKEILSQQWLTEALRQHRTTAVK